MISSIYAAVLALWILWLSLRVIKLRRKKKIRLGDGGDPELRAAIRIHGNAIEYIPIALILLFLLEMNGAGKVLINLAGVCLIIGRVFHYRALTLDNIRFRALGMQFTIFTIIALSLLNILYSVYNYF